MFLSRITFVRNSFNLLFVSVLLLGVFSCSKQEKLPLTLSVPICLENQSECMINTQFGELSVLFNQIKITPENEFAIFVGSENIDDRFKVTGYIEGKTMYMGKIPLFFSKEKNKGFKVANTMLGSCSDKVMVWILQLTVTRAPNKNTDSNALNAQSKEEHFSIEFTSVRE